MNAVQLGATLKPCYYLASKMVHKGVKNFQKMVYGCPLNIFSKAKQIYFNYSKFSNSLSNVRCKYKNFIQIFITDKIIKVELS